MSRFFRDTCLPTTFRLGAIPENSEPPVHITPEENDDRDDGSLATLSYDDDPELWQDMDPIQIFDNAPLLEEVHNNHT